MIKINIEVNSLPVEKKCELISFLYNHYDEIGYNFLEKLTGLAPSTVRNYRWRGDKTITNETANFFANLVEFVEGNEYQARESVVRYDNEEDFMSYSDGVPTTYICEIFGNESFLYSKPGKSKHLHDRMKSHSKNPNYKSDTVIVKKVYPFETEQDAEIMESMVIKYLKKLYKERYVRNDRFAGVKLTEEDMQKIENFYQMVTDMGD